MRLTIDDINKRLQNKNQKLTFSSKNKWPLERGQKTIIVIECSEHGEFSKSLTTALYKKQDPCVKCRHNYTNPSSVEKISPFTKVSCFHRAIRSIKGWLTK